MAFIQGTKRFILHVPPVYFLMAILCIGFILRTAAWWHFGFRGDANGEFETLARFLILGDWQRYFAEGRYHQLVNVLLLTPVFLFNLVHATYTFWLHQVLALGAIYIVFLIARNCFGIYFGLLSAFLISINLMIIFWFPWITGDIPFHFFFALFGLGTVTLFKNKSFTNYGLFFVTGILCFLTRPEGLIVFLVAITALIFFNISKMLSPVKSAFIMAGIIIFLAGSFIGILTVHKKSREIFLSNLHIAFPLYISTKISTNSPKEQQEAYNGIGEVVARARNNTDFVSPNYAIAMYGLTFIQEHPATWLKMYFLRLSSVIFPSLFSPWWSLKNRIYDFSMAFILIIGAIIGAFSGDSRRFYATLLTGMAFIIPIMVSFFQREMDLRVQLSMFILFAAVAPYGWYKLYSRIAQNDSQV